MASCQNKEETHEIFDMGKHRNKRERRKED